MPTCLFGCEAPKLTKEHIFGRKWIERVTGKPPDAKLTHTHAKVKGQSPFVVDGQERFAIQWDALEAGLVVNGVCEACNNGWMDRMDHATYPHIDPLVAGRSHTLTLPDQEQVARWATKIAILFDTHLEHPAISPALRKSFREAQQPFADWHIWVGRYELPTDTCRVAGFPTTKSENPPLGDTHGYICTFNVNFLTVQVLAPIASYDVVRIAMTLDKGHAGYVRRIWPPLLGTGGVEWPPPLSLMADNLKVFADCEKPL